MSRVQLALTVSDVDRAVEFYRTVFRTEPAKRRPGYANFAIADPPLKLVLIEGADGGTLNHLGVEADASSEVHEATGRFSDAGMKTRLEDGVECCYARQDKVWVEDPDGAEWEWYTVLGDSDQASSSACCTDEATSASDEPRETAAACC
jgi:catechol 2,3-dioxygenase-like lactoylglutathione lyase family enzyme